jgi:type II secretory pathway component PulJ
MTRRARGYTLMELGVVTILTTVLIFGMVRWLTGIGSTARVGFQDAADGRRAMVVEQIRRDVEASLHCDNAGRDARVRELSSDRVTIVVQADDDAALEIVGWRLNSGRIERGEAELDADCEGSPGNWGVWAEDVSNLAFTKITDGAAVSAGTAGVCGDELLERCRVDVIGVSISLAGDPAEEQTAIALP